jgi:hypothetical protein
VTKPLATVSSARAKVTVVSPDPIESNIAVAVS